MVEIKKDYERAVLNTCVGKTKYLRVDGESEDINTGQENRSSGELSV